MKVEPQRNPAKARIALGMSGGVDSSVSAVLLKEAGHEVTGVFLECWRAPGCRAEEDRKDALDVALKLGIPFQVLDFKEAYRQKVVEYFFETYKVGRTPNPDVLCNKEIKFGLFYDWAIAQGFDAIATGHYAQIQSIENRDVENREQKPLISMALSSTLCLCQSKDLWKDQTYFLYRLRQDQLAHVLFPIGHLLKSEVRTLAKKHDLLNADKPDSQGICFIGEINVHNFLKERLGENPGDVVDTQGRVIGRHKGLWFYTIGQRHGFDVPASTDSIPPFYVLRKDAAKNELIVGFGTETFRDSFEVEDSHWISKQSLEHRDIENRERKSLRSTSLISNLCVRIRHTGKLMPCTLNGKTVHLGESIQGIASGQSAVFYSDNICLGGGVIC